MGAEARAMKGLSERELRDVWARWAELRPDDLDWYVNIRVEAVGTIDMREPWEVAMNLRVDTVRPARHVAFVELLGTTPSGLSYDDPDDVLPKRTLCTWDMEVTLLPEFYEALIALWSNEQLVAMARTRMIGWEMNVKAWVWEQFVERGRG